MNIQQTLFRLSASYWLVLTLSLLMSGCASYQVQAPYDSFVCYKSTFNQCLNSAQSGQFKVWQQNTYRAFLGGGA